MRFWHDEDGEEFKNSDVCCGREYNPGFGKVDVAKISIRGRFSEKGWAFNEESHEMAVIVHGEGYIETKGEGRKNLRVGDVVCVEPLERFRWGGNFDMIIPCGPAFNPQKHHMEEE